LLRSAAEQEVDLDGAHEEQRALQKVEVDRTRVKPKVAIIGEFWAMTTEGDGNYQLQKFLEKEGAECDIQFVTAWILYNIWEVRFDTKNARLLRGADTAKSGLASAGEYGVFLRKIGLWAGDKVLRAAFQTFAHAGGFLRLPPAGHGRGRRRGSALLQTTTWRGGEGHMDGRQADPQRGQEQGHHDAQREAFRLYAELQRVRRVQSLITEKVPRHHLLRGRDSGDGAVNFQSRVQMYCFKAKAAAQAEFEKARSLTPGSRSSRHQCLLEEHPRYAAAPAPAAACGGAHRRRVSSQKSPQVYGKSKLQLAMIRAQGMLRPGARSRAEDW